MSLAEEHSLFFAVHTDTDFFKLTEYGVCLQMPNRTLSYNIQLFDSLYRKIEAYIKKFITHKSTTNSSNQA